ncbi:hypothetical protein ATE48_06290 [Candidatus Viadribacter manganicus]|uniref:Uncharacterized protein n=2 Tax=Candidatus Viadribacter manganicus TaxID=1759059 RepID=A0A1B1AG84_9PROT|nr:hypothetical protein ATE48_06290 [Candidatus Viadribacter manganicus]
MAALFALSAPMSRQQTTRLRESRAALRPGAKIIDAQYEVIGKRTVWSRIMTACTAVLWAAAIGFAAPQVWSFATQVGVFFAER